MISSTIWRQPTDTSSDLQKRLCILPILSVAAVFKSASLATLGTLFCLRNGEIGFQFDLRFIWQAAAVSVTHAFREL